MTAAGRSKDALARVGEGSGNPGPELARFVGTAALDIQESLQSLPQWKQLLELQQLQQSQRLTNRVPLHLQHCSPYAPATAGKDLRTLEYLRREFALLLICPRSRSSRSGRSSRSSRSSRHSWLPNFKLRFLKFPKFNQTILTIQNILSRDYKNFKSGFSTQNGGKTIENDQIELSHE